MMVNDDIDFIVGKLLTVRATDKNEEIEKILKLLAYTKSDIAYGANMFTPGYHSIYLGDGFYQGQRDPEKRLCDVPYNFKNKTVLDVGSNQGGMLFAVADKIKFGVGIDINAKMINVSNRLKSYFGYGNKLNFYVFDLDTEPLAMIENFLPMKRVDISFLLSVCLWVKKWRNVIDYLHKISHALLFESNGSIKDQDEQVSYLKCKYKKVNLIKNQSDDDLLQQKRSLYLCSK
jgi:SAM-dependent methyltransferase